MARYRETDPIPDGALTGGAAVGAVLTGQPLGRQQAPYQPAAAPPAPPAGPAPASTGDRVRLLQAKLNDMGAQPPLKVDGVLGPKTQAAMAKYGIDVNGNRVAAAQGTPGSPQSAPPAGGGRPAPADPAAPPAGSDADVRAKYGAWAWALDIPQVGDILRQAADEGWPTAQVQAAVEQTDWWRHTAAAGRAWQERQADDPAAAAEDVTQKRADIQQIAAQLGITISDDRLTQMATSVLKYGLDATQLQQMVGSEFHYQPGGQQGSLGKAEVDLRAMAGDYLVPISDQTLGDWESKIAQGMAKPEDFQNQIIGLARGAYKAPWIQTALDGGQTMRQISDPYRQKAAQLLEISPDQIDFSNPKWQIALTKQDKDGNPIGMDLATWDRTLRSDASYGWDRTQNARDQTNAFEAKFLQAMGRAPG